MKTATKIASVMAILFGMSVVTAGEAQAGGKGWGGKNWGLKHSWGSNHHSKHHWTPKHHGGWKPCYKPRRYIVIRPCYDYHYGFCSYYKRYGHCRYFVPGPVGGPPVFGTLPAPVPGSPFLAQPGTVKNNVTPSIDPTQLAAIVAALQASLESPKEVEQPGTIDPEILQALEQLIDQKLAEATDNIEPSLPEVEQVSEESEPESNNTDLEALRTMLAELLAQQKVEK